MARPSSDTAYRLALRGIADEHDHDERESEALARFLRPINPDPSKALADLYVAEKKAKRKAGRGVRRL